MKKEKEKCGRCGETTRNYIESDETRCDGGSKHNTLWKNKCYVGQQCRECGAEWED